MLKSDKHSTFYIDDDNVNGVYTVIDIYYYVPFFRLFVCMCKCESFQQKLDLYFVNSFGMRLYLAFIQQCSIYRQFEAVHVSYNALRVYQ